MQRVSDEERMEVAKRLRGIEAVQFDDGELVDCGEVEAELGLASDDGAWYRLEDVQRLADLIEPAPATGSTSDGYHTFDELYHHRAMLFSVVAKAFPDRAWKSLKHADGTMYDGMFIVGIRTPGGQATYHYDVDPYWSIFDCEELDAAPEWDGHTPEQAIERIAALADLIEVAPERTCMPIMPPYEPGVEEIPVCSECGRQMFIEDGDAYCPRCGAKVIEEES